ncbi:MAG: Ig-like domain-containing protein [Sporichthyaceae bacterium]
MTGRHAGRMCRRVAGAAVVLLALVACGQSTPAMPAPDDGGEKTSQARIAIAPAGADVAPDARVTVTSDGGPLRSVDVVDTSGNYIGGDYSLDRVSWTSTYPMRTATAYTVQATAADSAGLVAVQTAQFATRTVPDTERVSVLRVSPADGATVGVAHPLIVEFTKSVINRAEVTKALTVETFPRVEGSWYWIDAATVDWRPKNLWPTGTQVSLRADLRSIDAGKGRYGAGVWTSSFTVGRSQVLEVDTRTFRMKVVRDGKVVNTFPVSTGKPGWETRNGTKMIMEKVRGKTFTDDAIDAPEEYTLFSEYAMRVTNSGEFVHDASWNKNIGGGNGSHGCMGLNPGDMAWLFNNSIVGDAVVVTGSPAEHTELWNRVQDWNVPWERWLGGNFDLSDE